VIQKEKYFVILMEKVPALLSGP